MNKHQNRSLRLVHLLTVALAGAAMVLSFAPFEQWFVAYFCLAVLFFLCWNASPKSAFFLGLTFGYATYLVGVSWVYVSLSTYGGMPFWMGAIAVLGFTGLLALFVAATCAVSSMLTQPGSPHRLIALVVLGTVFEWGKSWVLTGFPWLDVGYSQTPTWLMGLAPVGGIYLVSFAVFSFAAALAWLVRRPKTVSVWLFLLVSVGAFYQTNKIEWSSAQGQPLKIALVQANVPINEKWQPAQRNQVISKLVAMSHAATVATGATDLDLIVWPETALPLHFQQTDAEFWQQLNPTGVPLLTGIVDSPNFNESYNAAVLSCDGTQQIYRKRHLVPFGEYLPLRFLFNWVLEYLDIPMSDFSSWQDLQPLNCGNQLRIGLSICYEEAFANEMRYFSGDATILVNISEDAWFGDSFAPHQRLQMAQMRARELSRPIARSANTGPSSFVDHRGKVIDQTEQFRESHLIASIQPQIGDTFYKRFGDWIIWLCSLVIAYLAIIRFSRSTNAKSQT